MTRKLPGIPVLKEKSDIADLPEEIESGEIQEPVVSNSNPFDDFEKLKSSIEERDELLKEFSAELEFVKKQINNVSNEASYNREGLFQLKIEQRQGLLMEITKVGDILTEFNTSIDDQRALNSALFEKENELKYYKGYGRWVETIEKRIVSLDEFLNLLQQKAKNINIVLDILVEKVRTEQA